MLGALTLAAATSTRPFASSVGAPPPSISCRSAAVWVRAFVWNSPGSRWVSTGQTGGTRRSRRKAAAFNGCHESDESRDLRPESVERPRAKFPGPTWPPVLDLERTRGLQFCPFLCYKARSKGAPALEAWTLSLTPGVCLDLLAPKLGGGVSSDLSCGWALPAPKCRDRKPNEPGKN